MNNGNVNPGADTTRASRLRRNRVSSSRGPV